MADEEAEGPPPPNIVASAKVSIRAPQKLIWMLMKDSAEMPKLYDTAVVHDRSLARDRITKQTCLKQTSFAKPKCVVKHAIEIEEPVEEDVPPPKKEEVEEGEGGEEGEAPPPAEAPAAEGEGAAAEDGSGAAPEVAPRHLRCEIRYPCESMGITSGEMEACNGTIMLKCTEPCGDDALECEFTADVAIYSESLAENAPDFSQWVTTLSANFKMFAEKMIYLCPMVTKISSKTFLRKILEKGKKFQWIPVQLARSPSALGLLASGDIRGSIGFYKDRPTQSPVPIGLSTRPKSSVN